MTEAFFTRPVSELIAQHPKSVVEAIAFGIDERGTGVLVKILRREAGPAWCFFPTPVAIDFARGQAEMAKQLGWDGNRIKDFADFSENDWSHPDCRMVTAVRADAFGAHVIIGLLRQDDRPAFHRFSGDLAKALGDEILEALRRGELIDLREQGGAPRQ